MQIFYSRVLVVDLDHAASLRNGPLALGFEVPIFVSIPNGPETTGGAFAAIPIERIEPARGKQFRSRPFEWGPPSRCDGRQSVAGANSIDAGTDVGHT